MPTRPTSETESGHGGGVGSHFQMPLSQPAFKPPGAGRPVAAAAEPVLSPHEPGERLQECRPAESRSRRASPRVAAREHLGVPFSVDVSETESKWDTLRS